MKPEIKILTSSMGLGTYVPSLFLYEYFISNGYDVEIEIIESYLSDSVMEKFLKSKETYHKSFKKALLGHKLAEQKLNFLVDQNIVEEVTAKWKSSNSELFLILSGNWMQIIDDYKKKYTEINPKIFTVHLDADKTPSWHNYSNKDKLSEDIWVFDEEKVNFMIEHPLRTKEIFKENEQVKSSSVYIHGGGWGMGTYQNQYEEFIKKIPYSVKTTVHDVSEIVECENWKYYLMDSSWRPWLKSEREKNLYPRVLEIEKGIKREINNEHQNGMYDLYQDCCAIISKPGGGTLLDCLITATPLVFLKPIAKHEMQNQILWEKLGLGISYEKWEELNFSYSILEEIYYRILEYRKQLPFIGERIMNQICLSLEVE